VCKMREAHFAHDILHPASAAGASKRVGNRTRFYEDI
jgi:hypothetical protein